jgi:hypothetical protein
MAAHSEQAAGAVPPSPRFRVQQTTVAHGAIPRVYGWRLLADAGADLPGVVPAWRPGLREAQEPPPPTLGQAIAAVARAQFQRWRPGGAPLTEMSAAASPILREYYRVGVGASVTDPQTRRPTQQSGHPWSAVFISYVMRAADPPRPPATT